MKKLKIIICILIFISLLCLAITSYGENSPVSLKGESEVEQKTSQTLTVEITNTEAIGVIEGILSYDDTIENVTIEPSYNGWSATYNPSTKKFNAYNATGTKSGEVIKITYNLKENASKGNIVLKDIELTTITYETINVKGNVNKEIKKKGAIIGEEDGNKIADIINTEKDNNKNDNSTFNGKLPQTGMPPYIYRSYSTCAYCSHIIYKSKEK